DCSRFLCIRAAAASETITCDSPCECHNAHGKGRWSVKTDPSLPPTDASAIQAVTPSDMFNWPGPDVPLTMQSERTGIENNWYALTGRVLRAQRSFARSKKRTKAGCRVVRSTSGFFVYPLQSKIVNRNSAIPTGA